MKRARGFAGRHRTHQAGAAGEDLTREPGGTALEGEGEGEGEGGQRHMLAGDQAAPR